MYWIYQRFLSKNGMEHPFHNQRLSPYSTLESLLFYDNIKRVILQ